jgi:hypothetical protein
MGPFPASQGAIVTVGLRQGSNRFQCVFPMIADAATGTPTGRARDLVDGFPTFIYTNWLACLCEDIEILGIQVEGMADDSLLPDRVNYLGGSWPGAHTDLSLPPQTSMILALYSTTQIAAVARTAVGKMFVGPSPANDTIEGTLGSDIIGLLNTLADTINAGFIGPITGVHWYRALAARPLPAADVHVADLSRVRSQVFTQRRRMTPLF